MSTQVMPPANGHIHAADNNILTATNMTQEMISSQPSLESISKTNSLDTPSRDDNGAGMTEQQENTNNENINKDTNNNNNKSEQQETAENSAEASISPQPPIISKHSSLRSDTNPLTMARHKKIKEGMPLIVKFDERVVVHTVPYWDPCGETFYDTDDDDQGPRGPNCCIML